MGRVLNNQLKCDLIPESGIEMLRKASPGHRASSQAEHMQSMRDARFSSRYHMVPRAPPGATNEHQQEVGSKLLGVAPQKREQKKKASTQSKSLLLPKMKNWVNLVSKRHVYKMWLMLSKQLRIIIEWLNIFRKKTKGIWQKSTY